MFIGLRNTTFFLFALMTGTCLSGSLQVDGQDTNRESATASPTPPVVVITQATPAMAPSPNGQSLSDLQARIAGRLSRPEVRRGQIGLKIVALNSGKVIFEQNGEKYLMPASNMKNFT